MAKFVGLICLLSFFLCSTGDLKATKPYVLPEFAQDTLLPNDITYTGYRLHIRNVEVLKQRRKRYLLRFDVVNTGRRAVAFGPGFPRRYLQTIFDRQLAEQGLISLALPIREELLNQRSAVDAGKLLQDLELWVTPDKVQERVVLTQDTFERQEVKRVKRKKPKPVPKVVKVPSRNKPDPAPRGRKKRKRRATAPIAEEPKAPACSDLKVSSLRVLASDKRLITLRYEIENAGSGALSSASLGDKEVVLSLLISGSDKLTTAANEVARLDVKQLIDKQHQGQLEPTKKLVGIQLIDTKDVTRYVQNLIVQIDGGQVLKECDETNNQSSILLLD